MEEVASHQQQEADHQAEQACRAALADKAGAGSEAMAKCRPNDHQAHKKGCSSGAGEGERHAGLRGRRPAPPAGRAAPLTGLWQSAPRTCAEGCGVQGIRLMFLVSLPHHKLPPAAVQGNPLRNKW